MDQVRSQAIEQQTALGQRLMHQAELELFEVPQTAVSQPR